MRYTTLGASRLEVSRLCLGTMNFGRHADTDASHEILDEAHEIGINYIDTANRYGTPSRPHASEEIIGAWFAKGGGRRERTVLATKVFEQTDPWPNNGGLSALNIRRACDASLRRLKTEHIDVYQMHHVDRLAPWDEIWEAFDTLRAQGKILYAGSSNFAGWHLALAQASAKEHHWRLISEQSVYSLARRDIEREVLPAARALGVGLVPWSPLAGGLLAGRGDGVRRTDAATRAASEEHQASLEGTQQLAAEVGVEPAALALSWLLAQEGVVAPIVGPRTTEQLRAFAGVPDIELADDVLARLEALWPGPGVAPEAYAW
ncbi:aldo/keto reductase [Microbacterium trichothecenolyticum]|uniref:Aldo/keto reductase n=1 Tax=Microbacterium ureisolvens TaxID=2781186 RepID=A0ABS7I3R8_9MICO|nr:MULTISPECIES: aldo/keto reductase [Microbacterium]MBW9111910.1 aldo/keto reductase [Microbacterium ureisolvens]MBW9122243.1 aldo/keto reductase [Microbacterium trichothecenolyticum]